jgi:DNA polymerase-4
MNKLILHIDFDSFFASVEQQARPHLRGKPMGVTATNGRTCIIASSREAKKLGIKTASRTFDAKQICPSIEFVPANFVKYMEVSKQFIAICKDYSPYLEMFSIDELFMDVTKTAHLFGGVDKLVAQIKERIKKTSGEFITVSVGLSYNKLLAKLASGLQKPNGYVKITPQNLDQIYKKAQLTDVCGIGPRIARRLFRMGIYSLLGLRNAPLNRLIREFGNVEGHFLKNIGYGIDASEIISYTKTPEVKSVSRNYCLPKNTYDKRMVLQNIYELCEEVSIKLRRLGKCCKTVGVSLRGNFDVHGHKTYSDYLETGKDIYTACSYFFRNDFMGSSTDYIRQMSIWTSSLVDKATVPLHMFDRNIKNEKLWQTIDTLNDKFGDHTIRNGFLLYADKLTTVPNGYGSDRYERTKLAQEATEFLKSLP